MHKNYFIKLSFLLTACIFLLLSCGDNAGNENNIAENPGNNDEEQTMPASQETTENQIYKDNVPEMNFEGYEFKILTDKLDFLNAKMNFEEETGDILNDSIYHRNRKIEERFNIVIKEGEGVSQIKNIVKSGSDEYSMVTYWCVTTLSYFIEGLGYKFTDYNLYIDLTQPYWDSNITGAMTFNNEVLFPIGASCLPSYDYTHVLLFNKQMISDLELESPYNLVASGGWTFDKYDEMAKAATQDLDGNGIMDKEDRYGFVSMSKYVLPSFWVAAGVESISRSSDSLPQFILRSNEKFASAIDKTFAITYDNNSWYQYTGGENFAALTDGLFINNQALFFDSTFKRVGDLRGMDTDFGIIPYPKYDARQETYNTFMEGCDPFIIPVTVEDPVKIGAVIEALTCESYNSVIPVYYDLSLKTKHARDEESAQMLDLIFANRVFDLGNTLWCNIIRDGIFSDMFNKNNRSLASELEKVEPKINKEIEKTLAALDLN